MSSPHSRRESTTAQGFTAASSADSAATRRPKQSRAKPYTSATASTFKKATPADIKGGAAPIQPKGASSSAWKGPLGSPIDECMPVSGS
jgi:hypothetical protein